MGELEAFKARLPLMRQWIDETLEKYDSQAIEVSSIKSSRIQKALPMEILNRARVVIVDGKVPVPPLSSKMGLTGLAELESRSLDGITYKDTFFINSHHILTEGLYFHELVHVVQWDQLGVDNFLLAYGAGILQKGYRNCPLEEMAYSLRDEFDDDSLHDNLEDFIREKTAEIWSGVSRVLSASSG